MRRYITFCSLVLMLGVVGCRPEVTSRTADDATTLTISEPGSNLKTIDFPAVHTDSSRALTPFMADVLTHLAQDQIQPMWGIEPVNTTHEELHGVNSYIRNHQAMKLGNGANGFYILRNRAVILPAVGFRKSAIVEFVPNLFRADVSYNTYIVSSSWDDMPTYMFDEWTAYLAGLEFGIDLAGIPGAWAKGFGSDSRPRPTLFGMLAFTAHALELGLAVEKFNPSYLKQNPNFDEFIAYNLKRSMNAYHKVQGDKRLRALLGHADDSDVQKFTCLESGADCARLRGYVDRHFGKEWADKVFAGR